MAKFFDMQRRRTVVARKLRRSVEFARESNRDFIETGVTEFKKLRAEAMGDARYWKQELAKCDT